MEIFIYQIHYMRRALLDPGFRVLDNSSNERADWFEYWPIRKFLLNEPLDEDSFYGFLSLKFQQKTNLSAAAVREFVSRESSTADVILLSPSLHATAYHLNLFQFGDAAHPGLLPDQVRECLRRQPGARVPDDPCVILDEGRTVLTKRLPICTLSACTARDPDTL